MSVNCRCCFMSAYWQLAHTHTYSIVIHTLTHAYNTHVHYSIVVFAFRSAWQLDFFHISPQFGQLQALRRSQSQSQSQSESRLLVCKWSHVQANTHAHRCIYYINIYIAVVLTCLKCFEMKNFCNFLKIQGDFW